MSSTSMTQNNQIASRRTKAHDKETVSTRVFVDPDVFPPEILEQVSIVKPHKDDRIFSSACAALIQHNRKSLANFTDPLRVEAITSAPTLRGRAESNETVLAIQWRNSSILIPFKLIYGAKGKTTLMCNIQGGWAKFEDYLALLPATDGSRIGHDRKALEAQYQWWSKNGKAFRLLDLPPEMRNGVYEAYAPSEVILGTHWQTGRTVWHYENMLMDRPAEWGVSIYDKDPFRDMDPERKVLGPVDTTLLRTCRQVHREPNDFVLNDVPKYFEEVTNTLGLPAGIQKQLAAPPGVHHLTKIVLDFDNLKYIKFFRVPLQPFRDMEDIGLDGAVDELKALSGLQELILIFQAPYSAQCDDPWGYTDRKGRTDREGFITCQKVLIDWIVAAAKKYIEHIPKIILTGAIKNSTKEKYDCIFREQGVYLEGAEGQYYDMEPYLRNIGSQPDAALPPECFCSTPCHYQRFDSIQHYRTCRDGYCGCNSSRSHKKYKEIPRGYKFDRKD